MLRSIVDCLFSFFSKLLKNIVVNYYINKSSKRCSGPKTNSGKNMQDISCPTPGNVKLLNVIIGGQVWKGLCSLYLRGGKISSVISVLCLNLFKFMISLD